MVHVFRDAELIGPGLGNEHPQDVTKEGQDDPNVKEDAPNHQFLLFKNFTRLGRDRPVKVLKPNEGPEEKGRQHQVGIIYPQQVGPSVMHVRSPPFQRRTGLGPAPL